MTCTASHNASRALVRIARAVERAIASAMGCGRVGRSDGLAQKGLVELGDGLVLHDQPGGVPEGRRERERRRIAILGLLGHDARRDLIEIRRESASPSDGTGLRACARMTCDLSAARRTGRGRSRHSKASTPSAYRSVRALTDAEVPSVARVPCNSGEPMAATDPAVRRRCPRGRSACPPRRRSSTRRRCSTCSQRRPSVFVAATMTPTVGGRRVRRIGRRTWRCRSRAAWAGAGRRATGP